MTGSNLASRYAESLRVTGGGSAVIANSYLSAVSVELTDPGDGTPPGAVAMIENRHGVEHYYNPAGPVRFNLAPGAGCYVGGNEPEVECPGVGP